MAKPYKTAQEKLTDDQKDAIRALKFRLKAQDEAAEGGVVRTAGVGSANTEIHRGSGAQENTGIPTHDMQGRQRVSTDREWEALPQHARTQDPPSVERAVREGAELEAQDRAEEAQQRADKATDRRIRRDPVLRNAKKSVAAANLANPLTPTVQGPIAGAQRNRLLDNEVERQRKHEESYQRARAERNLRRI